MLFNIFTAGLACTVSLAAAWTQPTGDAPEGNAIYTPGSSSIVPVGKPFEITWNPTTQGTVTLLLLKGPSSNAVPQYAIAESIANSGSYSWTPKTDLAPGETGYGIELIVDATGQYQYSTQFGISNPGFSSSSSASVSSTASSAWTGTDSGAWPTGTWPAHGGHNTTWAETTSTDSATTTWTSAAQTTPATATLITTTSKPASNVTLSTGWKPSSTATATTSPVAATGAAATMATSFAGLVFAAGVAVFAL